MKRRARQVTSVRALPTRYVELAVTSAAAPAPFVWSAAAADAPGPTDMLARGVPDAIAAEAVLRRFSAGNAMVTRGAMAEPGDRRFECSRALCLRWGMPEEEARAGGGAADASACCQEVG